MSQRPRRICVVTGTRAEYGLLRPLLRAIQAEPRLELQLVVTGAHLSATHGQTIRQIEADGFQPAAQVDLQQGDDSPLSVAQAMGRGTIGLADAFARLQPDLLVLLGDRFEILAAAQAAMVLRLPIAHIHGGETTEGLIDEAIRHSITKMAQWHFVSAEAYRKRVIQLGEAPERVWTVGALGLDAIRETALLDRAALAAALQFDLDPGFFIITYHPVTLSDRPAGAAVAALLQALEEFPTHKLLITGANADPGHAEIHQAVAAFAARHPGRVLSVASLGQQRYLSALKHADAAIGNSSSGLIETPAFKLPTVNIGDRQRGRERGPNVIDADESAPAIAAAIRRALAPGFRASLQNAPALFGDGHAAERILQVIAAQPLDGLLMKQFRDLP